MKNKKRLLVYCLAIITLVLVLGYFAVNTQILKPSLGSRIARLAVKHYLSPRFSEKASVETTRQSLISVSKLAMLPPGTRVEKLSVAGMNAEWVKAGDGNTESEKAVLYFHGGGFFSGSCATHRELAARISRAGGVPVLVPEYRLAPEHKFPAANEDCLAAYKWLLEQGFKPENIAIGGDSAGGCLTLMTLLSIRDAGDPLPAAAFLLSPLTDAVQYDGESFKTRAKTDPWFKPGYIRRHMSFYIGGLVTKPPILSPVRQDLAGLPPMLVQVGNDEVLLSDSTRLTDRAKKAGVDVTLEVWDHMWHVFQAFAVIVPEARQAIGNIGDFLKKNLGD